MAGVIGLRGPDIEKRDALRGYQVEFTDADRPFVRPHTGLPVLHVVGDEPVVERHVFGFTKKFTSFNARDDRLLDGKMWSRMFGRDGHHGVAPVSYILEWADIGDGHGKRPWRIERRDGAAMAVPALTGAYWEDRAVRAFALVTTAPNEFVGRIHDRVIGQLADNAIDAWLHPADYDTDALLACITPGDSDDFIAYPMAGDAGAAKFNDPAALAAIGPGVTWRDLQSLGPRGQQTLGGL